jgi:hypothetical protein
LAISAARQGAHEYPIIASTRRNGVRTITDIDIPSGLPIGDPTGKRVEEGVELLKSRQPRRRRFARDKMTRRRSR